MLTVPVVGQAGRQAGDTILRQSGDRYVSSCIAGSTGMSFGEQLALKPTNLGPDWIVLMESCGRQRDSVIDREERDGGGGGGEGGRGRERDR